MELIYLSINSEFLLLRLHPAFHEILIPILKLKGGGGGGLVRKLDFKPVHETLNEYVPLPVHQLVHHPHQVRHTFTHSSTKHTAV